MSKLSKFSKIVNILVRSCFLITLIKCLRGHSIVKSFTAESVTRSLWERQLKRPSYLISTSLGLREHPRGSKTNYCLDKGTLCWFGSCLQGLALMGSNAPGHLTMLQRDSKK